MRSMIFNRIIRSRKLLRFVETKRYMDFKYPGSQAKEGTFFGLESCSRRIRTWVPSNGKIVACINSYPGGPILNPLGLAKDISQAHDWKLKEIKNGRLAMVAMLGIFVQAYVIRVGPIENLIEHVSNPWHRTVIQTLTGFSS